MMPGIGVVRGGVPTHRNLEKQIERQMGCMTGFIQLFDRHQLLAGRRLYSTKRLPSSSGVGSTSPSEKSEISTASLIKDAMEFPFSPSPDESPENRLPTNFHGRPTLPLPVFEIKDGLKGSRKLPEAPRLSLDSRANVDTKGKLCPREIQASSVVFAGNLPEASEDRDDQGRQRRSPSVVARLMGLEELPVGEPPKRAELRRSASESRVSRDPSQFNFQNPVTMPSEIDLKLPNQDRHAMSSRDAKSPGLFQRKSFDAQEFFPEPKRVGPLSGEIEKRLRMRGVDEEPVRDLETLKQILEALQLKGLLHSNQAKHSAGFNDFHGHRSRPSPAAQAPIVVIKPARKSPPRLAGSEPPTLHSRPVPPRRQPSPAPIPPSRIQRELEIDRRRQPSPQSGGSPEQSSASRNTNDQPKRRSPPPPQRRLLTAHSPKPSSKRLGPGQPGPPKHRRPTTHIPPKEVYSTAEDDDASTSLSENRRATAQFDFESGRNEDYSSGRRLLERCDKLLNSIAAITSSAEQVIPTDRQLSPVSVLDSSFVSEESSSSLPKLDQFTGRPEDRWKRQPISTTESDHYLEQETTSDIHLQPADYAFVLDILHVFDLGGSGDEAFVSVENRHRGGGSPTLRRRLIFDTVAELVSRKLRLSPWENFSGAFAAGHVTSLAGEVWEELCRIQERIPAADAMEATCSLIRKDMAAGSEGEQGWGLPGEEMSEAVLHIERLVFKDLVADAIREMADLTGRWRRTVALSRRKLVF